MGTLNLRTNAGGSVIFEPQNTATDKTVFVPAGNGTMATTNQIMGFKNHIHNGGMSVNQRNTVITTNLVPGGGASAFTVDRWKAYGYNATGNFDAVLTTQQHSDHPVYGDNGKCLRTLVTTADTVGSGVDFFVLRHDIEGFNSAHFYNKELTLSFWVKTSTTGTYGVQLRATGTTDGLPSPNFITTYTISAADTWEYKTITIPPQNLSTTQYTNGNGYTLYMTLVSGQNESSPGGTGTNNCLNQWGRFSSDGIAATTLSNTLTAATNRYFQLTDIQLEVGAAATPFEQRPYGTELAICRYYFKTVRHDAYRSAIQATNAGSGGTPYFHISAGEIMRATPSITSLGPNLQTAIYGSGTTARSTGYDPVSGGMSVRGYVTGFGSSPGEVMGDINLQLSADL